MYLPTLAGRIDRRMLINFSVEPAVLARNLPDPFRPIVTNGVSMVGICLIRLTQIRPAGLPACLGVGSENAAHRAAVEWDEAGEVRRGVFIWRRDTASRFNAIAGGRLFPGLHHRARFAVRETDDRLELSMHSDDGLRVDVAGTVTADWPNTSRFTCFDEASAFFREGAVGFSPRRLPGRFDGMQLSCDRWHAQPLAIERAASTFFDDPARWPGLRVDNALVMRGIEHRWVSRQSLGYGG